MKWKTLESQEIFSSGIFSLRKDRCEMPDGRIMPGYYIMDFPDWVNVFPVTSQSEVLLIKQYRHASQKIHIEVPGGSSDPHRKESMEAAALRELLEETGYSAKKIVKVGAHFPNPAMQSNRMHSYVALDCEQISEPKLDPYEDLDLYKCSLDQVRQHISNGDIDHTIMMTSMILALNFLDSKENL